MRLYSTKNKSSFVSIKEAVLKGHPDDNGLFMFEYIPVLPKNIISNLSTLSFQEIAFFIADAFLGNSIPKKDLKNIIDSAISFPAPIVELDKSTHVLELFHGPTLAFKDFGARFMAQLMSYYNRGEDRDLIILAATSGDTGGAVASAFYNVPGIKVVIVYPSSKVSLLQEQQITTYGKNILAVELDGNFDDCQHLVKQTFLDIELNKSFRLSSANSINIARLIPQCFYYFEAFKQVNNSYPLVFSVPSGNFGNLTAGLMAKKMGLPIFKLLASTNINDVVPKYLKTGIFQPMLSISTISNAMDVGNPSNFFRILDLYDSSLTKIKKDVVGYSCDDEETKRCIFNVYKKYNYILDPHGAVGFVAFKKLSSEFKNITGIILETAHPAKFDNIIESTIKSRVIMPPEFSSIARMKKISIELPNNYDAFKSFLYNELN